MFDEAASRNRTPLKQRQLIEQRIEQAEAEHKEVPEIPGARNGFVLAITQQR
jgi:hypothetical protein